jgi:hypothetical protein
MVIGELEKYRKNALTAAKELTYSQDTLDQIELATSITQIGNAMVQARHMLFDESNSTRKNNKVSNEKN